MNVVDLQKSLEEIYDWREAELIVMKQLPISSRLSQKQKKVVTKYSVANIYAIWEGFVKDAIKIYIREINALNLTAKQLHTNLLAHSIDTKLPQITTGVQSNFEGKKVFITELVDFLDNHIILVDKLPTESNIKYKVINEILSRFNLEGFAKNPFESYLNDLLNFRNKTSHGENVSFITAQIVEESANHVIILMQEIIDKILQGCNDKSYLAIP